MGKILWDLFVFHKFCRLAILRLKKTTFIHLKVIFRKNCLWRFKVMKYQVYISLTHQLLTFYFISESHNSGRELGLISLAEYTSIKKWIIMIVILVKCSLWYRKGKEKFQLENQALNCFRNQQESEMFEFVQIKVKLDAFW